MQDARVKKIRDYSPKHPAQLHKLNMKYAKHPKRALFAPKSILAILDNFLGCEISADAPVTPPNDRRSREYAGRPAHSRQDGRTL